MNATLFLLGDNASMMNGIITPVDGGITVNLLHIDVYSQSNLHIIVVNATLFLLSDNASMMNGIITPVDGGITVNL